MRKVNKKISVTQAAYVTEDGTEFSFEGPAREHETYCRFQNMKEHGISEKSVLLPFSDKHAVFFFVRSKEDLSEVLEFLKTIKCRMEDVSFKKEMWYGYIEREESGKTERAAISFDHLRQVYKEEIEQFFSKF
jgi:hypothetical protein